MSISNDRLWKGIGLAICGEACPRRVLHPNYTMEGVNLAPMKEEKRLTFHSPNDRKRETCEDEEVVPVSGGTQRDLRSELSRRQQ